MASHGDKFEERPPLDSLLADLDRDELAGLLLHLAGRDPNLARRIEDEIALQRALPAASGAAPQQRRTPIDVNAVRRQMSAALHAPLRESPGYRGWYYFQLGPEARQLLEQAWAFIRAGDGRSALEILNVMTDECLENWQAIMEDEEGQILSFVQDDLGPAWTEAVLSADLTASERDSWSAKLDTWVAQMADYWDVGAFDPALQALAEGWDDPALRRVLRGEAAPAQADEEEDEYDLNVRRRLTGARLNVLERQGRVEEYLNLARAGGLVARYTAMLARQGRPAEAANYGLAHLSRTDGALTLAQALREVGELEGALRVGERGLGLEGKKAALGTWLADLAAGVGRDTLAVHAATVAFEEEKSPASYLRVKDLAGEGWPERREVLLNRLRTDPGYYLQGPVDIFLHEGLIDDAIDLVDRTSYTAASLVEQVADAALQVRPDWVIRASRKQAEPIMDAKKADKYGSAAHWLGKAKEAYRIAGRGAEWEEYLSGLLQEHHRKHKLVPLLKALR